MIASTLLMIAQAFASSPTDLAHVDNTFQFVVDSPLTRLAPLFGPLGERNWAGQHWNPEFIYPQPAKDVQGAIFTVRHGPHTVVWVNTVLDLAAGKMQYVYLIPDTLVTTVDVKLTPAGKSTTKVEVTYRRTALNASANDDVRAMGGQDRDNGPNWRRDIEAYLLGK